MPNVHILPPEIISKIAAGEVVERPASVIKELVENALDAGTQSIELHLENAGKTSIRIKDTGSGITQENIGAIFHRHATSKIKTIDDLFNIHSLGFRGEALYSIAAIADVTLRSRGRRSLPAGRHGASPTDSGIDATEDAGWEIHMRGGKKLDLRPVSIPVGTEIEVRELFFNTPARRKFLKSYAAEITRILNTLIPYTLLYPRCRFLVTHENRTLLDLAPSDDPAQRAAHALNLDKKHILDVKTQKIGSLEARMLLGDINILRSRRDMQFIFVNDRPVQNKNITFHMNDIYRLILPQKSYPFFALHIQLSPRSIDVNIHPSKREVKIKDEHIITSLLRSMCEKALMTSGPAKLVGHQTSGIERYSLKDIPTTNNDQPSTINELREPTTAYSPPRQTPMPEETLFTEKKQDNLKTKLSRSRYIGPFMNKFLLFESDKSLLVMDQHAAQERVTFEQLIRQMEGSRVEIQNLLSPYLIKLPVQDILLWEESKDTLESVGLSTTQFDDETIAVHTYPVLLKDPQRAVRDILAGGNPAHCDRETLARRACRASVMAGDSLKPSQAEYMREELIKCRDPFTCPHGRPTVVEMTENFLNKQFLRT